MLIQVNQILAGHQEAIVEHRCLHAVSKQFEGEEAPVSQAVGPLLLAKPRQGDIQRHRADEGIVLDLLARGKCGNLLVLVQVSYGEVLSISLQAAPETCQLRTPVALEPPVQVDSDHGSGVAEP